ncbi:hypothetical protein GDO81_025898 [Engystomops pustulosus]|uniref:Uncharacterized protein n=1 Tax=Engystomops pustulosus TaxID=76066 RepID=A0AAV6YPG2_ENGPU|nr:hypothetical protein GDO81_025898 [Engystomops pustulosus]
MMCLHHVYVIGFPPSTNWVQGDQVRDGVKLLMHEVWAFPGSLKLVLWHRDQHPHLLTHLVGPFPGILVIPTLLVGLGLRHIVMYQLR